MKDMYALVFQSAQEFINAVKKLMPHVHTQLINEDQIKANISHHTNNLRKVPRMFLGLCPLRHLSCGSRKTAISNSTNIKVTGRLTKFKGEPTRPGELSFSEWLSEFEQIVEPFDLEDKEKARALVDHLVGSAREEVMCLSDKNRSDYSEVKKALELYFSVSGTAQSASVEFHNRRQGERESLADFSRSLIRLHNKMETTAPMQEEAKALGQLRNRSLRDQFSGGAREEWVRKELRRISLATQDDGF
ncbi:hypothetical protein BSL78_23909 [Apostichopus japonicus]|uniref:Paraneoplastic antigen Ma-like C-terminal domain-containing protein n=1 Tax=Stichopus japonicus TaxID=307972 RepID=A0A2G8JU70_STIJA|nr:hypothetical protein BSL78_23909 [Apostichopus japonicus]